MPRVTPKADLVVALDSGVIITPDGAAHTITLGQRCYASRDYVRQAPGMFASINLDDQDLAEARKTLLAAAGVLT